MRASACVFALFLAACAAANHAEVHAAGRQETFANALGEYCDHCAGGPQWMVDFTDPSAPGRRVRLLASRCSPGTLPIDEERTWIGIHDDAREPTRCTRGTVRVADCSQRHVKLTFEAQCGGKDTIEGRFDGDLTYRSGYD